jgi:hypothetical protein
MDQKITDLLTKLAEKLGTTIEHLWRILIQQAHVQVAKNLTIMVVLAITEILISKNVFRLLKNRSFEDIDDFKSVFMLIVFIIVSVVTLIYGVRLTLDTFDAALNPEYWAFRKIFELVKY